MGIVSGGFLLVNIRQWGGSPHLLETYTLPFLVVVVLPCAAAVTVFLVQRRHRVGVVPWERGAPRAQWRIGLRGVGSAVGTSCFGIAGGVVVAWLVTLVGGLPGRILVRDTLSGMRIVVSVGAVIVVVLILAGAAGWIVRAVWLPIVMFGLYFVALLVGPLGLFDTSNSTAPPNPQTHTLCHGTQPRVCTDASNEPYLPAASQSLTTLYETLGGNADGSTLPGTVYLVSTQPQGVTPAVATLGSRGIVPPESLDSERVRQDFAYTFGTACSANRAAFDDLPFHAQQVILSPGLLEDNPSQAREALRRLTACVDAAKTSMGDPR